jgi:hypothetical protein
MYAIPVRITTRRSDKRNPQKFRRRNSEHFLWDSGNSNRPPESKPESQLENHNSWINSLPLIDTSCTCNSSRTQTRSRSDRTYSSKTTSCRKPNQYQATRQQPSQNRTRGFQLHFPKHNRLKHSVNQNFRRS